MTIVNKWEAFSESFEQKNTYVVGQAIIDTVKAKLAELDNLGVVLELGCGNGTYTSSLVHSATSILATDLSEKMVETTKQRFQGYENVRTGVANCAQLPYSDDQFDTVLMANLLHIIPCRHAALLQAKRVLKPGGRLIVMSMTQYSMSVFRQLGLMYRYIRMYGNKPAGAIKLTPQRTQQYLDAAMFEDVQIQILGNRVKALYAEAVKARP
ncbi:class I SAM-dependent methyltransferase [Salinivibrio sp. ES.052]|uniref:class I SAM-dependent methyltransferase n=1 Tax=Salinivibrio sp. ES.052 TaxID=1882823 RepID=UPI000929EE6C|nr:class I SAM-dependent methyltransferase [Salinivibrio sp. ES.052]SIN86711.1 Methyltransferase domain-containing protein [Salinivibrio sp. ES.052]